MFGSAIDYANLVTLLTSPYGAEAREAMIRAATSGGVGPIVSNALASVAPDERAARKDYEDKLRRAFAFFEAQRNTPKRIGHSWFSIFANELSQLARSRREALAYGYHLLNSRGGDGALLVTSPLVRGHVERVMRLIHAMGAQYIHHPCCWKTLVNAGFDDLSAMGTILICLLPSKYESRYKSFRNMVERIKEETWTQVGSADRETLILLNDLRCRMDSALAGEDYHGLLQLLLENCVHVQASEGMYDDFEETLKERMSETAAPILFPANDSTLDTRGTMEDVMEQGVPAVTVDDSLFDGAAKIYCDPAANTVSIETGMAETAVLFTNPCAPLK